ncbi:unnamed protein product [Spirodela intermedia]|uniref:Uncharacterized protein n=1 Tax=Spirodela intermedia TaxID=51605 RepID=A0A7I8IUD8_SPIIN|nr:unnamed protein product [Spirodela intermedia]CAA6661585.1 unnamed protein product [Spirodela intermedia]
MDKGTSSELFVNDGSFMERFIQLQQENQEKGSSKEEPKSMTPNLSASMKANTANTFLNKRQLDIKPNNVKKPSLSTSGGKLAFSLKQKSKISVAPVKLGVDEDEPEEDAENVATEVSAKRQKSGQPDPPVDHQDVWITSPPSDLAVRNVADKLAGFVAKNGRQFENITRQRNPGDTPFKFLFDLSSADYKYYEYRLLEEEKLLAQQKESQAPRPGTSRPATSRMQGGSERSGSHQHSNYQTPASALYDGNEGSSAETSGPPPTDPIAMMEFYMKKAPKRSASGNLSNPWTRCPPSIPPRGPMKKGHHMGDFIPPEELEKFMSNCNDAVAQKSAKEAAEKAKIQADNVGHKLLSKMGWKEGEGLGSSRSGRAEPVAAGNIKLNNLGVGAEQPGEVTAEDDIYEQYKKRMMLGYRYRPNPLNNPRKAYY